MTEGTWEYILWGNVEEAIGAGGTMRLELGRKHREGLNSSRRKA